MKKNYFYFLVAFLGLTSFTAKAAAPEVTAGRATGAITLDGVKNEAAWANAGVIAINKPYVGEVIDAAKSCNVSVLSDDDNVYLFIEVVDGVLWTSANDWKSDKVEIYFSLPKAIAGQGADRDHGRQFVYDAMPVKAMDAYVNHPDYYAAEFWADVKNPVADGSDMFYKETATGYIYEAKINKSALDNINLQEVGMLGFDAYFVDNDGGGSGLIPGRQRRVWNNDGAGGSENWGSLNLGILNFAKPAVVSVTSTAASHWGQPNTNAFDGKLNTAWSEPTQTGFIQVQYSFGKGCNGYKITNGDDADRQRDLKNWTLKGSNNGTDWTLIDTQNNASWTSPLTTNSYRLAAPASYLYYRFDFVNNGNTYVQMSEIYLTFIPLEDKEAPSYPSELKLKVKGESAASVSWVSSTDNVGIKEYIVYVNGTEVGKTVFTNYALVGLNKTDRITVKATDAAGNMSDLSDAIVFNFTYPFVVASAEVLESWWYEPVEYIIDGKVDTKWAAWSRTPWVQLYIETPTKFIAYSLTNGPDEDSFMRDFKDWQLLGSADNDEWVVLDTQVGVVFGQARLTKTFPLTYATPYKYYKINCTANNGNSTTQMSEWRMLTTTNVDAVSNDKFKFAISKTSLELLNSEAKDITIMSLNGSALLQAKNATSINITNLSKGAYLVKVDGLVNKFIK